VPTGTLNNLSSSGFVRTPPAWAQRIVNNLLSFSSTGTTTVFDPTAGEGDLLAPAARIPGAQLSGVEISQERLAVARRRLPQATLIHSGIEGVRVTPGSMSLVLANPPYFFEDGKRAEYRILAEVGAALRPGGILVAILPARTAWDAVMVRHWCKFYQQIRCWKFPDGTHAHDEGAFERYTQIVVVGVRRARPLAEAETAEQARLSGWRWRAPKKQGDSPWAGGAPPPDLPEQPIADPYLVPAATLLPEFTQLNASEATLLEALSRSGVQQGADWTSATTWQPEEQAEQPVMPPTGEAHLAAEILTGLLDGEVLTGPDAQQYVFVTCVTQTWRRIQLDAEELEKERQKGVARVEVQQQEDHPILGVLHLASGAVRYLQGEEVFEYLTPWLPMLAGRVLEKRQPLYRLDPAAWELEVCARIGLDKQLPGSPSPGLVPPQLHRVFAMGAAIDWRGRVAIQGEPGTGKTRQSIALVARQAHLWRGYRRGRCPTSHRPAWLRPLRLAWQRHPRARALLGPTRTAPAALPVLVTTPRRVTTTWQSELKAAWPEAEVVLIEHWSQIDHWMQRCVESQAPAVVGILPHSLSRAFGREWRPAVREKTISKVVPELHPREAQLNEADPIHERGVLVGYRLRATGEILTREEQVTFFYCPDCGARVESEPFGQRKEKRDGTITLKEEAERAEAGAEDEDADALEPVTERVWFETKPRWCRLCHAALWSEARVKSAAAKAPPLPFATWASGAEAAARMPQAPGRIFPPGNPIPVRPGGRLGKADRAVRSAIPKTACRLTDAAGTHAAAAPESWSPFEFLQRFYAGCVALTIVDESHNARGRATDIAHAVHLAGMASQTLVYASGTHYGGCLDDLYHYWFRFHPRFWKRFGLGWSDVEQAIPRFGVVQQWTREHEEEARRGSGQSDVTVTTIPAPGISARLLPFLLGDLVFLSVLDVGAYMPPRTEVPEIVEMRDPLVEAPQQEAQAALQEAREALQEARQALVRGQAALPPAPAEELAAAQGAVEAAEARERAAREHMSEVERWALPRSLALHYDHLVASLRDLAMQGNPAAALAQGTVPRWWAALPCVQPRFSVIQTKRGAWGQVLGKEQLLETELLTPEHRYPLERRLQDIVRQELAEGHTVMLYVEQNGVRSMADRLALVLQDFAPWKLPDSVEAEDREDAIRQAVARGHKVIVVNYRRVAEGINLQDCIDAIVWVEMALNLFHLDQASRRAWRLGRDKEVRIYYLAYTGSAAHHKLCKLASESGAAAAFSGEPAQGALVEHVGADRTMLSRMAASLKALGREAGDAAEEELAGQEALTAAFQRRSEELAARLKQGRAWMGLVDTLPERLAAFHAARAAAPRVVEARPGVEPSPEPGATPTLAVPRLLIPPPATPDDVAAVSLWGALDQPVPAAHQPRAGARPTPRAASTPREAVPADPAAASAHPAAHSAAQPPAARPPVPATPPAPVAAPSYGKPAAAAASGATGLVRVDGAQVVIQFTRRDAGWVEQIKALVRQHRGRGWTRLSPSEFGWLLPLSAAQAARAAFPQLAGWEQVEDAPTAAPVVPPATAAAPAPTSADPLLAEQLARVERLYWQLFDRAPDEAAMRQHIRSALDAERWLANLQQRLEQKEAKQRAS
jgi:SAM-dependent methyltransferase